MSWKQNIHVHKNPLSIHLDTRPPSCHMHPSRDHIRGSYNGRTVCSWHQRFLPHRLPKLPKSCINNTKNINNSKTIKRKTTTGQNKTPQKEFMVNMYKSKTLKPSDSSHNKDRPMRYPLGRYSRFRINICEWLWTHTCNMFQI